MSINPAVAYYIILNKAGKIVAMKLIFVTDPAKSDEQMHEMITSLLEKYRLLMIEESETCNDTYHLIKAETIEHRNAKKCLHCARVFEDGKVVKTCYPSWDTKVEY